MAIYLTADQHFFHKNIIRFCERPFKNTHYMHKTIIANYRAVVREEDEVYFLGDFTMEGPSNILRIEKIMEDLPGTKHLILGNHDKLKPFSYHEIGFSSVHTALKVTFEGEDFFMAHDPAWAQIKNTKWICGHIHNHWRSQRTDTNTVIVNVGVDVWDFSPVSLEQILTEFEKYEE